MSEFTAQEVERLRRLLDIEDIRQVHLLYAQYMDSRRIDDLADLFTEQAICRFGPYGEWHGREVIRSNYHGVFNDPANGSQVFGSQHHSGNHWVELTGKDTAAGRSYLIDVVTEKPAEENPIVWFGVYDDTYERVDGRWQIASCSLQFLWPERHLSEGFTPGFPPSS